MTKQQTIVVKPIDDQGSVLDAHSFQKVLFDKGMAFVSMQKGDSNALLEGIRRELGERVWCDLVGEVYTPNPFNDDSPSKEFLNLIAQHAN